MEQHGWIIYNGYLPGQKFRDFAEWIHEAAGKQNLKTTIYKNSELLSLLTSDTITIADASLQTPDFVVFLDKDIYLARQLELMGIRVFNCADAINISDDKILSYQALASNNLPIPKTVIAPKSFYNTGINSIEDYQNAIQLLGFPMIVKEAFGAFGEQVYLINNQSELADVIMKLLGQPFLLQEFIHTSYGHDKRLQVVGDEVVAAMVRYASSGFRSNVTAGGRMEAYKPDQTEKNLAVDAIQAIGADFGGVDILHGPNNTPIICEVNSNAHIHNLFDCTGINAADAIITYILDKMR